MSNTVTYIMSLKDLFTQKMNEASQATDNLDKKFSKLEGTLSTIQKAAAAYLSFDAIKSFGQDIYNTTLKVDALNSTLKFSEGSVDGADKRFNYLVETSNRLGLSLESAASGYTRIAAAAKGTVLEGRETEKIFEGVSSAASVMHLSTYESEGALNAISQMMSKGKVQAEELRGQLGERIPGAFQIAARAMNMTTAELDKFMSDGKLVAADFLPKFANQLKKEFGDNIPKATESAAVASNLLKTNYFLLMKGLSDGLRPAIITVTLALTGFVSMLQDGVSWMKENSTMVKTAAVFIGTYAAGVLAYNTVANGAAIVTRLWSVAQWLLNAAMIANPVGLIIAAVAAFAAGIYYAYQKSEEFRATLIGLWEVIKNLATAWWHFQVAMHKPWDLQGIKNAFIEIANLDLSESFRKGYNRSKADDIAESKSASSSVKSLGGASVAGMPQTISQSSDNTASKVGSVKPTTININIGKFQDEINVYTTNVKDSAGRIAEEFNKILIKALNDSQRLAGA